MIPRTTIDLRSRVVTLLTSATDAGTNVFNSRKRGTAMGKIPFLAVYTPFEVADDAPDETDQTERVVDIQLVVEAWHRSLPDRDDAADKVDELAYQVRDALRDNPTLSATQAGAADGPVSSLLYQGWEQDLNPEGNETLAMVQMTYIARVRVVEQVGESVVNDLDTIGVTYENEGADPGDVGSDVFTVAM